MRTILLSIASLVLAVVTVPAAAQDLSDPGCAAIEEWGSTLSANRSRMATAERGELRDQAFTDERTEPVFGLGYSRWQLPHFQTAESALTRCRAEADQRGAADTSYRLAQAYGLVRQRLRTLQRVNVNNPSAA